MNTNSMFCKAFGAVLLLLSITDASGNNKGREKWIEVYFKEGTQNWERQYLCYKKWCVAYHTHPTPGMTVSLGENEISQITGLTFTNNPEWARSAKKQKALREFIWRFREGIEVTTHDGRHFQMICQPKDIGTVQKMFEAVKSEFEKTQTIVREYEEVFEFEKGSKVHSYKGHRGTITGFSKDGNVVEFALDITEFQTKHIIKKMAKSELIPATYAQFKCTRDNIADHIREYFGRSQKARRYSDPQERISIIKSIVLEEKHRDHYISAEILSVIKNNALSIADKLNRIHKIAKNGKKAPLYRRKKAVATVTVDGTERRQTRSRTRTFSRSRRNSQRRRSTQYPPQAIL